MKTFELSLLYRNRETAVWYLGYNKIHTIQSGLKMRGSRRALFQLLIYLDWWQRIRWEGKDYLKVTHKLWGKYSERGWFFFLNSKSKKKDNRSADYWSFFFFFWFLKQVVSSFSFSPDMGDRQSWKPLRETVLISS